MPAKDMTPEDERSAQKLLELGAKMAGDILDHVGESQGGDALTVVAALGGCMLAGFSTVEERVTAAEKLRVGMLRMAETF